MVGFLLTAQALALAYTVPRSLAYGRLLDENLVLKEQLDDIDRRMAEVDRLLLRMRLYDAQLRSLRPAGDHGPVAMPEVADEPAPVVDASGAGDGPAWEDPPPEVGAARFGPPEDPVGGVRAASEWATSLSARVAVAVDRMERIEPNLTELVVELEDLRALESALPRRWPASGRLTSRYGWRRNPVGARGYRFHSGIDIANRPGTPIYAASDGVVVRASFNSGYGRQVVIDHGYGISTTYSHCQRLLVRLGQRVKGGQKIATMGSSGRSTGPHLHYEVHLDGNAVDPMDYVPAGSRP